MIASEIAKDIARSNASKIIRKIAIARTDFLELEIDEFILFCV